MNKVRVWAQKRWKEGVWQETMSVTVVGHLSLLFSSSFRLPLASQHRFPYPVVLTLKPWTAPNWLPHVWVAIKTRHDTFLIHDIISPDPSTSFWMLCNHSVEWHLFFSLFSFMIMWPFALTLLFLWLATTFPFSYSTVPLYKPVIYFVYVVMRPQTIKEFYFSVVAGVGKQ